MADQASSSGLARLREKWDEESELAEAAEQRAARAEEERDAAQEAARATDEANLRTGRYRRELEQAEATLERARALLTDNGMVAAYEALGRIREWAEKTPSGHYDSFGKGYQTARGEVLSLLPALPEETRGEPDRCESSWHNSGHSWHSCCPICGESWVDPVPAPALPEQEGE